MALREYQKKRNFNQTPEPSGQTGEAPKTISKRRFVVQKHKARSLHYDLRLEFDGVLKSWAIPKTLPLDPAEKRLASLVEDHPLDYIDFEGVIPEGNYGAGAVIVWDRGNYLTPDNSNPQISAAAIRSGLQKGHITFILQGKKLHGEYALIRLKNSPEKNAWLLIRAKKGNSEIKRDSDFDRSAKSGKTLDEVALENQQIWGQKSGQIDLPDPGKETDPTFIEPMSATLIKAPFDDKKWQFEVKWDGYRVIAVQKSREIYLYSRNRKNFNDKFKLIVENLKDCFAGNHTFDGEIVALDDHGKPNFHYLQNYPEQEDGLLVYFIFDLLHYKGHRLIDLPLRDRRAILENIWPNKKPSPHLKLSKTIKETGKDFFAAIKKMGLEGMIAKNIESRYRPGKRSLDWLKVKNHLEQEAIICGFVPSEGGRRYFSSLILGAYQNNQLIYLGNVGSGFTEKELSDIYSMLLSDTSSGPPFALAPKIRKAVWTLPLIVCEIRFQEWTNDGLMRQPVFLGLRPDKLPSEVIKEIPI